MTRAVHTDAAVVDRSVDVDASPEAVFDYCVDLTREHEWNPKLRRVEKLTVDPIAAGTRFNAQFLKGDPMTIEYVGVDRPWHWESAGRSRRLDVRTYGRVTVIETGVTLTLRMELRPHGLPRFMLPLLARYMHRRQALNLGSIKALLEG